MENNKNILDNVLGFLGVLSLIVILHHLYKALETGAKTNVISDNAIKAIQNPDIADKLREAVDNYHDTGEWNKKELESIL